MQFLIAKNLVSIRGDFVALRLIDFFTLHSEIFSNDEQIKTLIIFIFIFIIGIQFNERRKLFLLKLYIKVTFHTHINPGYKTKEYIYFYNLIESIYIIRSIL